MSRIEQAKSAYSAHFLGSYSTFIGDYFWKAETEGKHKFFAWLLVQCKILAAYKLMARQWPCNPHVLFAIRSLRQGLIWSCIALLLSRCGAGWKLDTAISTEASSRSTDHGLVAEGACTAVEESKKAESSNDDLLCLEYLEGGKPPSL
jgi:hypothetical protein